ARHATASRPMRLLHLKPFVTGVQRTWLPKPILPNWLPILSRLLRHRFIPPTNRLRKNEAGLPEIQWFACLGQQDTNPQDAQKVRPARPQRVKGRGIPSGVR